MQPISYKRHRFPPETIQLAVWLYFRFTTSLRNVEDMLAERGISVSTKPCATGRTSSVRPSPPTAMAEWTTESAAAR